MLDTIREFGAERLADSPAASGTRNRFVDRYLVMARYFRDHFLDDDQLARLRELRREHANVRAALELALRDQVTAEGIELAIALSAATVPIPSQQKVSQPNPQPIFGLASREAHWYEEPVSAMRAANCAITSATSP